MPDNNLVKLPRVQRMSLPMLAERFSKRDLLFVKSTDYDYVVNELRQLESQHKDAQFRLKNIEIRKREKAAEKQEQEPVVTPEQYEKLMGQLRREAIRNDELEKQLMLEQGKNEKLREELRHG